MKMMKALDLYFTFIRDTPKKFKKRVLYLIPLLSLSAALEVVSLALLIPLMSLSLESRSDKDKLVSWDILGAYSNSEKIVVVFLVFIVITILKGGFVLFVSKLTFSTALAIKVSLQNKLFSKYLKKDFVLHLDSNSANYLRNITTECHQIEGRFIMPGLTLMAEVLPVLFVLCFLIYLNPFGVIVVSSVLSYQVVAIAKRILKYLKRYGTEKIKLDKIQVKFVENF